MIPRIKRIKDNPKLGKYLVMGYLDGGHYGSDACQSLFDAFRFWLYHCGVSPRICFWIPTWKREKYNWEE